MPDSVSLADSRAYCRHVARAAARNFYYGFLLLPGEKRDAICALYAFMRGVDDISDEPGAFNDKRRTLAERRAEMDRALDGEDLRSLVWPAFCRVVLRYSIPRRYLHGLISGAEMDLSVTSYETFDALREYCYRVAGTVGLCSVHIFGFNDPRALQLAEELGIAFQLTNILRDLPRDLAMGRTYLPLEDLRRFGVSETELRAGKPAENFKALIQYEVERARESYRLGESLVAFVSEDSRAALWALARIYAGILDKIEGRGFDIFSPTPARLSAVEKVWILARARLGWRGENDAARNRDRDRRGARRSFLGRRAG